MFPSNGLTPAPGSRSQPVPVASTPASSEAAKQAAQQSAAFALAALAPAAQAGGGGGGAPVHHYIHRRPDGGHAVVADQQAGALASSTAVVHHHSTHIPTTDPKDATTDKGTQPALARPQIPAVVAIAPKQAGTQTLVASPPASQSDLQSPTHDPQQVQGVGVPSTCVDPNQAAKEDKPQKDKSKLRKGKWTVEEEEYTSRIIHHFSTGVLTLPEGTTLRSYLAEKLNCDPMRITKKFAGASCLGKRVYHLCDRSPGTTADIEIAKAELARLEQRFRLRVEHGQRGVPMPPRIDVLAPMPQSMFPPAAPAASWLQRFASVAAAMSNQVATPTVTPAPAATATTGPTIAIAPVAAAAPGAPGAPAATTLSFPFPPPPGTQWVATTIPAAAAAPAGTPAPATVPPPLAAPAAQAAPAPTIASAPATIAPPPQAQIIPGMPPPGSDAVTTWAWAQAAAQLTPAVAQLAAANIQQHQQQLQKAYEAQLQQYAQQTLPQEQAKQQQTQQVVVQQQAAQVVQQPQPPRPAQPQVVQQQSQTYQQLTLQRFQPHMAPTAAPSAAPAPASGGPQPAVHPPQQLIAPPTTSPAPAPAVITTNVATAPVGSLPTTARLSQPPNPAPISAAPVSTQVPASISATVPNAAPIPSPVTAGRTKEDEAAGTMLVGFLNSLRKGFMEAKDQKDKEERMRGAGDMRQATLPPPGAPPPAGFIGYLSRTETSSGRTSHAADSSLEDSASEQTKEQSSSEESDRDAYEKSNSGPPRKRIKTKRTSSTFTSENVAQHNSRMDALHGTAQRYGVFGATSSATGVAAAPAPSSNATHMSK